MDNDKIINTFFVFKFNKYILKKNFKKIFDNSDSEIQTYILNKFEEKSRTIKESLLRLLYNIENIPKCPICGNLCYFKGGNIKEKIYLATCNNTYCYEKLKVQRRKETFIKKYGVEHIAKLESYHNVFKFNNPQKNPIIKEKTKQTMLNKYGKQYALQINEFKEKQKQTCLEKYGVEYASQNKQFKERVKQTCLKKYGVTCPLYGEEAKNKTKQTNLKRYGCENGGGSIKAQEKIKNTLLNHFGVDSYSKTEKFKNYMHVLMSSEEMQQKIYNTQKKNNSFNKSKSEDLAFELLKKKYPDIIHHYKDNNRYPFCCDFYIPSLDLFIECQFGMYHNKRPYIGDFNDLNEIELLKEKSKNRKKISGKDKSRYDSVIYTWSILDPKKRKIAKQNKLNFIEFWNIEELKKWINETDKRYI